MVVDKKGMGYYFSQPQARDVIIKTENIKKKYLAYCQQNPEMIYSRPAFLGEGDSQ